MGNGLGYAIEALVGGIIVFAVAISVSETFKEFMFALIN